MQQLSGIAAVTGVLTGSYPAAAPAQPVNGAPFPLTSLTRTQTSFHMRRSIAGRAAAPTANQPFPTAPLLNGGLSYLYFTTPIFMGIFVGLFIVIIGLIGVYELMIVQNPDRFASTSDKCLTVPAN